MTENYSELVNLFAVLQILFGPFRFKISKLENTKVLLLEIGLQPKDLKEKMIREVFLEIRLG